MFSNKLTGSCAYHVVFLPHCILLFFIVAFYFSAYLIPYHSILLEKILITAIAKYLGWKLVKALLLYLSCNTGKGETPA